MRKQIVAGNWKLNKTLPEAKELANEIVSIAKEELKGDENIIICPPFVNLTSVNDITSDSVVSLGAQNCYSKNSGAYTGEVAPNMLSSVGVSHVIIGHSERREFFDESNELLKEKTDLLLEEGLTPLFCCGETLAQREAGIHFDFVKSQLTESLFHLSSEEIQKVVIAYEPIWAIGTGVTASSDQAQEMHKELRDHLASKYGQDIADNISLLYGGSCKPGNAQELFSCPDVDGGLIGGASLSARDFIDIVKSF